MKPMRLTDAIRDKFSMIDRDMHLLSIGVSTSQEFVTQALMMVESGLIVTPADEALALTLWEQDGTVCPVCGHHGYQPFTIKQILDYDEHECQWVNSARRVAALEDR